MKIIDFNTIRKLDISLEDYYNEIKKLMLSKNKTILPPKTSMKLENHIFYNVMPSVIPEKGVAGVKVVTRYPNLKPAIKADILLYDLKSSELLALIDGTFITAIRTGAVAALAINTLAIDNYETIAIMGLGNTARATLLMLLKSNPNKQLNIKLLKYKEQENSFIDRFKTYENINFECVDTVEDLMTDSDVILSCVTYADNNFGKDEWFKEGCLVVPVHTLGFQNCDLFFDKAIVDDYNHVKSFKYYDKLKYCAELSEVLKNEKKGRENNKERIIAYNIGISIEDICLAKLVYDKAQIDNEIELQINEEKYWV